MSHAHNAIPPRSLRSRNQTRTEWKWRNNADTAISNISAERKRTIWNNAGADGYLWPRTCSHAHPFRISSFRRVGFALHFPFVAIFHLCRFAFQSLAYASMERIFFRPECEIGVLKFQFIFAAQTATSIRWFIFQILRQFLWKKNALANAGVAYSLSYIRSSRYD